MTKTPRIWLLMGVLVGLTLSVQVHGQSADKAAQLFENGQYAEAKVIYEQLLARSPKNTLFTYRYARCLQELGEDWQAIDYFRQAGDRYTLCHFFLAESLMKTAQPEEAIEKYQTFLSKTTSTDRTAHVEAQIRKAEVAKRYIRHVREIAIRDTFRVKKEEILSAYRLSAQAGKLLRTLDGMSHINAHGDARLFSAVVDTMGTRHLFSQYRLLDKWEKANWLPETVNSTSQQDYPFCLSDGVTIYFAAQDKDGMGGWDIYMTRYNTATNTYLKSENIGYPFNSPANDYLYVEDEEAGLGYFASDRFCPADSVTVYCFRLEETPTYLTGLRGDTVQQMAELRLRVYDTAETTPVQEATPVKEQVQTIRFVLNTQQCYTSLNDFRSADARNMYQQYLEEVKAKQATENALDALRKQYSNAITEQRQTLGKQILEQEKVLNALTTSLNATLQQVRDLENAAQ